MIGKSVKVTRCLISLLIEGTNPVHSQPTWSEPIRGFDLISIAHINSTVNSIYMLAPGIFQIESKK